MQRKEDFNLIKKINIKFREEFQLLEDFFYEFNFDDDNVIDS